MDKIEVMLYLDDVEKGKDFWINYMDFKVIEEIDMMESKSYVISQNFENSYSLVLHNKEIIKKISPEINLSTPSLLFESKDFYNLYKKMSDKKIKVGEIIKFNDMETFNFSDFENNYFAVKKSKK